MGRIPSETRHGRVVASDLSANVPLKCVVPDLLSSVLLNSVKVVKGARVLRRQRILWRDLLYAARSEESAIARFKRKRSCERPRAGPALGCTAKASTERRAAARRL